MFTFNVKKSTTMTQKSKTSLSSPAPKWNPAIMLMSVFFAAFKNRNNGRKVGYMWVLYENEVGNLVLSVGPHWYGVLLVVLLIIGGTWMNIVFIDNSILVQKIAAKVVVSFFCTSTLLSLMMTACRDPGIVRTSPVPQCDTEEAETAAFENSSTCDVCNVLQLDSLRIRHCYDCGVCIEGHDHHCPWMGKCIGKKNMRWVEKILS